MGSELVSVVLSREELLPVHRTNGPPVVLSNQEIPGSLCLMNSRRAREVRVQVAVREAGAGEEEGGGDQGDDAVLHGLGLSVRSVLLMAARSASRAHLGGQVSLLEDGGVAVILVPRSAVSGPPGGT